MKRKLNIHKTIIYLAVLNMIQIAAVTSVILYNSMSDNKTLYLNLFNGEHIFLYIIFVSIFINSFFVIKDFYSRYGINAQNDMLKSTLLQLGDLNKTLRAQRHDFLNHLQIVYSLIELDDYAEAKDYIEKVFNDIQKVSQVLKTSNPAVNALLQAKLLYGEKRGIITKLNITSQLKDLKVPSWEFCRVIGNIIDNGIYSLQEKNGDKILEIEIYEELKLYRFRIENNGPMIPESIIGRIFETGFTTKGEYGEGMGLSIVKDILSEYGGGINVKSNPKSTVFEGWVQR